MANLTHLLPDGTVIARAAEELGITREHLSAILNGKSEPSWKLALRITERFPKIERWMLKPELWGDDE